MYECSELKIYFCYQRSQLYPLLNRKRGLVKLEHKVFGRISFIYAIDTSSAVLLLRGTMIRYEVSRHVNIIACLLPFEVAGRGPMQSMAHPAKGTFGISKCMGRWV